LQYTTALAGTAVKARTTVRAAKRMDRVIVYSDVRLG
jgi:hypothetical protein